MELIKYKEIYSLWINDDIHLDLEVVGNRVFVTKITEEEWYEDVYIQTTYGYANFMVKSK